MSMIDFPIFYCVNERPVRPLTPFLKINNPIPMPHIHFIMVVWYFTYFRFITKGLRPNTTIIPLTKHDLPQTPFCIFLGARYPTFGDAEKLKLSSKFSIHVISRDAFQGILMKGVTSPGSIGNFKPMFEFLISTTNKLPLEIRKGVHGWHGSQ